MLILTLIACAGDGPGDADEPQITGTLTTDGNSAEVAIYKAFGWDVDGKGMWYLSSSPNASCDAVVDYLTLGQVDPTDIWEPGTCNITLIVNPTGPDAQDYEGELSFTDETEFQSSWNVRCAMGEGAFEWGKRDEGASAEDEDYFWTGFEWTGAPEVFSANISGDKDSSYELTMELDVFDGSNPVILGTKFPADGQVTGSIEAEACNLYNTQVFPR
jgi:hypothetical protein